MKKLYITIFFAALFCFPINPASAQEDAPQDIAVEKAIADFLHCKLSKNHNAFSILIGVCSEYAPYKISDDLMTISILPEETKDPQYFITLVDTLGSTRLPTRHIIVDGKLFYWRDKNYGLTEETLKAFIEFNLAEPLEISDTSLLLGLEGYGDGRTKAAQYYFCKNDLRRYKRVITSIGVGGYKPPKIKCK